MKKINKKGFMMAELVVVGVIILTVLVSLYTSYNKIYSIYKSRIGYYDVATLYRLGYYRDLLNEYDAMNDFKSEANTNNIAAIVIKNGNSKVFNNEKLTDTMYVNPPNKEDNVFLVYNNKNEINSNIFNGIIVNQTFKDYIDYLTDSIDFTKFEYMLIMEKCNFEDNNVSTNSDDNNVDIDKCNYAYLEIFESEE